MDRMMDGFCSVMDESNWKGKWNVVFLTSLRDFKNMWICDILKEKEKAYVLKISDTEFKIN